MQEGIISPLGICQGTHLKKMLSSRSKYTPVPLSLKSKFNHSGAKVKQMQTYSGSKPRVPMTYKLGERKGKGSEHQGEKSIHSYTQLIGLIH